MKFIIAIVSMLVIFPFQSSASMISSVTVDPVAPSELDDIVITTVVATDFNSGLVENHVIDLVNNLISIEINDLVNPFDSTPFNNFIPVDSNIGLLPAGIYDFQVHALSADTIIYSSFEVSSVPVPAAIWLFGSGLLGLVGVARRKKA